MVVGLRPPSGRQAQHERVFLIAYSRNRPRSEAMIALADLDSLYVDARNQAVPTGGSGDVDAIGATRADVIGMIGEEDAILASLRGRLRE